MKTAALIGNPNTGKSTIFNRLTGLKQHTGNWSGKTVGNACGKAQIGESVFMMTDLPGIYSLDPVSEDEKRAVEFIKSGKADLFVIILDATCLERNLILALQVINCAKRAVVCLNLTDEAKKRRIFVDEKMLSLFLKVPVIPCCGADGTGLEELKKCMEEAVEKEAAPIRVCACDNAVRQIYAAAVRNEENVLESRDRKIDDIVLGRRFGLPIVFAVTAFIFWLTAVGANYPSRLLEKLFCAAGERLDALCAFMPDALREMLVEGAFGTLGFVVSVMLPPMAIFFPLFTILEDLGYLPRMAFNMDRFMRCAKAHGKMVLTMCMGLGCNAVGVTSARIIESPRERLIAILTNTFVPCNGRFPTLILMISLFAASGSIQTAFAMACVLFVSLLVTTLVSRFLSGTFLKGQASSTVMELPPYRRPQIGSIITRSILDRTLFVLGRAAAAAAPAGVVIWLLQNVYIGGENMLAYVTGFFEPLGRLMGMDGCTLAGFVIGMPANEIVVPVILMCYKGGGGLGSAGDMMQIKQLLVENGWGIKNAVCVMLFSLCHFPCTTTLITIKKETGSLKWTALAFILPTVVGMILCISANLLLSQWGV